MPWPLQCQVPADALASSASSAGGFISAGAAPLSAAAAAFMSPAGLVSLGCATASPVIPTIATATLKNLFMIVLLWENARTILKSVLVTSRHAVFRCHGQLAAKAVVSEKPRLRFASPIDVVRFAAFTMMAALIACGGSARPAAKPVAVIESTPAPAAKFDEPRAPDPDLHRPPPRKLLDIDWTKVALTDDAAALALWRRIAPTGADWDDRIEEVPAAAARPLAIALLHGGN